MSINDKYHRVRTRVLLLPLLAIFLGYILVKFLLPDYCVQLNDLKSDSAIVENIFKGQCPSDERMKDDVYKSCIDITLVNKPYLIRLTDPLTDNYWHLINDRDNISKRIEVKFQSRLLHKNILYNPEQISIDNKIIIPYDSKKSFIGWSVLAVLIGIMVCLYFTYSSFKTYKTNLYGYDKSIGRESKWKLFFVWLMD